MASFSSCGVFGGLKVKALASPWSVGPSDDEEDGEIVVVGVFIGEIVTLKRFSCSCSIFSIFITKSNPSVDYPNQSVISSAFIDLGTQFISEALMTQQEAGSRA